jgi:putative endonuclease
VLHKRAKGNKGEDIACKFIQSKDFQIVDRNYLKKWGELDIVAKKDNIIHFFEVKSVTGDFSDKFFNAHRPEDNVDGWKVKHLRRIIETYLEEKGGGLNSPFQFHVLCVFMNLNTHRARVKWLKNMIL